MSYLLRMTVLNAEGRIEEICEGNLSDKELLVLAHHLNLLSGELFIATNFYEKVFKGTKLKKLFKKRPPRINSEWYITVLKRISSINTVRLKIQHTPVNPDSTTSLVAVKESEKVISEDLLSKLKEKCNDARNRLNYLLLLILQENEVSYYSKSALCLWEILSKTSYIVDKGAQTSSQLSTWWNNKTSAKNEFKRFTYFPELLKRGFVKVFFWFLHSISPSIISDWNPVLLSSLSRKEIQDRVDDFFKKYPYYFDAVFLCIENSFGNIKISYEASPDVNRRYISLRDFQIELLENLFYAIMYQAVNIADGKFGITVKITESSDSVKIVVENQINQADSKELKRDGDVNLIAFNSILEAIHPEAFLKVTSDTFNQTTHFITHLHLPIEMLN